MDKFSSALPKLELYSKAIVIGFATKDREGSPNFIYPGLLVKIFAKFFKLSTFLKSKKAPIKFLIPTLFDFAGSRDLLSASKIFENSKNVRCIIVAYRSFLDLSFRKKPNNYMNCLIYLWVKEIFLLLINFFC